MKVLLHSLLLRFFRKKSPVVPVRQPVEVHLSEFNNLWNQMALEESRPDRCPGYLVDKEKIRLLQEQMNKLRK